MKLFYIKCNYLTVAIIITGMIFLLEDKIRNTDMVKRVFSQLKTITTDDVPIHVLRKTIATDKWTLPTVERVTYLKRSCAQFVKRKSYNVGQSLKVRKISLVYCPVQKAGSTKMVSSLQTIDRPKPTDLTRDKLNKLPQNYTKLIMVRDPYTRLVSAYINKIFRIESRFVETIADLVSVIRGWQVNDHCIQTRVTFDEYVRYVIQDVENNQKSLDIYRRHWFPHSIMCSPCDVQYNYIMKLETFKRDLNRLWKLHNVDPVIASSRWKSAEKWNDLETTFMFVNCTSTFLESLERYWVSQQMVGQLSRRAKFPYRQLLKNRHNQSQFNELIQKSKMKYPVRDVEREVMRETTLRAAFQSVSPETMDKFRKLFHNDFVLYGYDKFPEYLKPGPISYQGWKPFQLTYT